MPLDVILKIVPELMLFPPYNVVRRRPVGGLNQRRSRALAVAASAQRTEVVQNGECAAGSDLDNVPLPYAPPEFVAP